MAHSPSMSERKKRVCIIGAGTAGLCAAKNALENGMLPMVFEQTAVIGGLWNYREEKSKDDELDEKVSANVLYEGLRTNFPKEAMGFYDYSYPCEEGTEESFVEPSKVLKFLHDYMNHFKLMSHIKLQHSVIRVRPRNDVWEIIVQDIKHNKVETHCFDFVLVCNGRHAIPSYPAIKGMDIFKGTQTHSYKYRSAEAYKDKTILTIGFGPSGVDISLLVAQVAKTVLFSHHAPFLPNLSTATNIIIKPDVKEFTADGAIFQDDTTAKIDGVIYCTGYKTVFPFLSVDCGIHVEDKYVQPLYKHCVNITYPTMAIIGLPYKLSPSQLIDLQLRFVFKYYSGQRDWPQRNDMLADTKKDMNARWARGLKKHRAHEMGLQQFQYFQDLADTADIPNIKPAVLKILRASLDLIKSPQFNYENYRQLRFRINDDESYVTY